MTTTKDAIKRCLPSLVLTLILAPQLGAQGWELPVSYDMSFPEFKAYRYGPMLGGIGTGGFSLNSTGLSNFNLFHYQLNEGCTDGSFIAVYAKSGNRSSVRFLQSYGRPLQPAPAAERRRARFQAGVGAEVAERERREAALSGERLGAAYGQKMVAEAYCSSLPPAVSLRYADPELPVDISLTAFSPLIPHNYDSSNLPVAVLVFQVANRTTEPAEVSVALSLENVIGRPDTGTAEGTRNRVVRSDGLVGVLLETDGTGVREEHRGTVELAVPEGSATITYLREWASNGNGSDFFSKFSQTGELGNSETSIAPKAIKAGALAAKVQLAPGESREIPFFVGWYFPKMNLADANITSFGTIRDGKEFHYDLSGWSQNFSARVKSAQDIVRIASQSYRAWWKSIQGFHSNMAASGIPSWLVSRYFHDLTYIPGFTYWIEKDGENYFLVQEGQFGNGLCTLDVDGYNWLVLLWPRLELQEMKQLAKNQWPSGESCQELAMNRGSHGNLEARWFIIRTYQDYVWTLDREFLDFMWPYIKKTIQYTLDKEIDSESGLGKVDFSGVNSYDSWRMDGFTAYGNSQWLACLKMAQRMAAIQKDRALERQFGELFDKAQRNFIKKLWVENGKWGYFKLCTGDVYDAEASSVEQLIGAYWGDHFGFEILPSNYVRTALDTIYNLNSMGQLGWVCGRFPDGRVPLWDRALEVPSSKMQHSGRNRGTAQWQLASLLLTQGRIEEGNRAAELIFNLESTRKEVSLWTYPYYLCYFEEDGRFGGYFPPIYTSYPRMGSWGYYVACAGLTADESGLRINPRVRFNRNRQVYFARWGNAEVEITATGSGSVIAGARVNGEEWKQVDAVKGVFLPASIGLQPVQKIQVEIEYR